MPARYKINRLPKNILTQEEIKQIFRALEQCHSFESMKAKAIIETLYSTGIRFGELKELKISDINFAVEVIYIRQRKTRNDRYVPMTLKLKEALLLYIHESRPYSKSENAEYLFTTPRGKKLHSAYAFKMLKNIMEKTGIKRRVHFHLFRHTFAVHLLKSGCSMRYIKELLGHKAMSSTEVYTEVDDKTLREEVIKHHPFSNEMDWVKYL